LTLQFTRGAGTVESRIIVTVHWQWVVAVYSDAALRVPVYSVGALSVYRVGAHFNLHGLQ
jgi:hypothetical protein